VALRLYRGVVGLLPTPVLKVLLKVRDRINELKGKPVEAKEVKEE